MTGVQTCALPIFSGIDLDLDANVDVLALDSTGVLYAFNSDLILMAGFPSGIELQAPILARDLFNDEHPEIVAKSADSSSIYKIGRAHV